MLPQPMGTALTATRPLHSVENHEKKPVVPMDYRRRMEPRFQGWLQDKYPTKKPSLANKLFKPIQSLVSSKSVKKDSPLIQKNPIPRVTINDVVEVLKKRKNKPLATPSATLTVLDDFNLDTINTLPSELIGIVIQYAPIEVLSKLRTISKTFRDYIDNDPELKFWQRTELDMLQRELPACILNIFGSAQAVQNLPFVEFSRDLHEAGAVWPGENPSFKQAHRVQWLDRFYLRSTASRGISLIDGAHFIALKFRRPQTNDYAVVVLQESSVSYKSFKGKMTKGWFINDRVDIVENSTLCVMEKGSPVLEDKKEPARLKAIIEKERSST